MLRTSHCLDSRLTNGNDFVSLKFRLRSTPQKHFLFLSLVLISLRGWVNPSTIIPLEGLATLNTFIHLIGSRTRDFPAGNKLPPKHYKVIVSCLSAERQSRRWRPRCLGRKKILIPAQSTMCQPTHNTSRKYSTNSHTFLPFIFCTLSTLTFSFTPSYILSSPLSHPYCFGIWRVLTIVFNAQNCWVCGLCPTSGILIN
jgi:hypothetical protein